RIAVAVFRAVCWCRLIALFAAVVCISFFFFHATAASDIYTLSLHDALPIWPTPAFANCSLKASKLPNEPLIASAIAPVGAPPARSEEHTSELQSRRDLVCRLLLEKKKKQRYDRGASRRDYLEQDKRTGTRTA